MRTTTGDGYLLPGAVLMLLGFGGVGLTADVGASFLGGAVATGGGILVLVGAIAKGVHLAPRANDEDRIDIARETAAQADGPDAID